MAFKLTDKEFIAFNKPRVLSVITIFTIKKGSCTIEDIIEYLKIPKDMALKLVDELIEEGKIDAIAETE